MTLIAGPNMIGFKGTMENRMQKKMANEPGMGKDRELHVDVVDHWVET